MAIDPNEVVDTTERKKPDPNFPGKSIIVTTVLHRDGRAEQWQRGEADPPDAGVKIGQYVDPDARKQFESDRKAEADAAKAAAPDTTPKTVTAADGRVLQYEPKTDTWKEVGPAKAAAPAAPPTIHTRPDGAQEQWNPTTARWEPYAPAKPAPDTGIPDQGDLGANRPGMRVDINALDAQRKAFVAGLNADKNLTPQERNQRYQTYYASVIQPQIDRATAEANAEADRQVKRQQEQDRLAQRNADLAGRREDRLVTAQDRTAQTAQDRLAFDREQAGYSHGRDAVADALALMKYRVDPSFSPSLAGIYNAIVPGAFQPNAFSFNLPDTDAIAAAHVDGLLSLHANTVAPRAGAAVPPPAPVAATPVAAQTVPPVDPLAGIPVAPRVPGAVPAVTPYNRDLYAR